MYRGKPEMYTCDAECIRICDEFLDAGLVVSKLYLDSATESPIESPYILMGVSNNF
jgi:hypothetical protein